MYTQISSESRGCSDKKNNKNNSTILIILGEINFSARFYTKCHKQDFSEQTRKHLNICII